MSQELDEAVAKALDAELRVGFGWQWPWPFPNGESFTDFTPDFSTDWNWAMWAAEKAGMFDHPLPQTFEITKYDDSIGWEVSILGEPIGEGSTGPEAICCAILRFKEYGVAAPKTIEQLGAEMRAKVIREMKEAGEIRVVDVSKGANS